MRRWSVNGSAFETLRNPPDGYERAFSIIHLLNAMRITERTSTNRKKSSNNRISWRRNQANIYFRINFCRFFLIKKHKIDIYSYVVIASDGLGWAGPMENRWRFGWWTPRVYSSLYQLHQSSHKSYRIKKGLVGLAALVNDFLRFSFVNLINKVLDL